MTERRKVRTLEAKGADARKVQEKIAQAWDQIKRDPAILEEARKKGIDDAIFAAPSAPFTAERPGNQWGIDPNLIIWFSGVVTGRLIGKGVDWLWDDVLWPRVRQGLGGKVRAKAEPEEKPSAKG
jgi:hypothetical protein